MQELETEWSRYEPLKIEIKTKKGTRIEVADVVHDVSTPCGCHPAPPRQQRLWQICHVSPSDTATQSLIGYAHCRSCRGERRRVLWNYPYAPASWQKCKCGQGPFSSFGAWKTRALLPHALARGFYHYTLQSTPSDQVWTAVIKVLWAV